MLWIFLIIYLVSWIGLTILDYFDPHRKPGEIMKVFLIGSLPLINTILFIFLIICAIMDYNNGEFTKQYNYLIREDNK